MYKQVIFIFIIVVLFAWLIFFLIESDKQCSAKGGVIIPGMECIKVEQL